MRPSDWYITLLNDIDAKLTDAGISTRVVFLLYVDLLWEPQKVRLNNPDRFTLMFAPITRTYSASIASANWFDEEKLPPFTHELRSVSGTGKEKQWGRGTDRRISRQNPCSEYYERNILLLFRKK